MIVDYVIVCVGVLIGCPIGVFFGHLIGKMFEKFTKNSKNLG